MLDQLEERAPMPVDAEGVGQGQRHLPPRRMGERRRRAERLLGVGGIEEIALEIDDPGPGDQAHVDVGLAEMDGGPEKRPHGPLGVGRDEDEAAAGGGAVGGARSVVEHSRRAKVVAEDLAELVIADLAHVFPTPAEGGHADDGIGGRAAGDLHPGTGGLVELPRPRFVDQAHGSLHQPETRHHLVGGVAQHVHQRVADTQHVELGRLSHGGVLPPSPGNADRGAGRASCARGAGRRSDP